MKVLIADKFEKSGIEGIKALGCEVVSLPDTSADQVPGALAQHDPDVLIVRSTKVQAPAFAKPGRLSLIIRAGAGVDNIDVPAASARGVFVANCPGRNSAAVAELVWGLILACDRRIPDQVALLRAGVWNKKEFAKARGLAGRTLGVVGLGRIGREIITRGQAFGMNVVAWSRSLTEEAAAALGVTRCESPVEVARRADVVSVNVAANEQTKKLCNAAFFEAMRPNSIFVNTSRGTVVDEPALLKAIEGKGVRAGLDVFDGEPPGGTGEFKSGVAQHLHVYGTHHVGASTDQAQEAVAEETIRILRSYRETGEIPNVVNREVKSPAIRLLTVTHLNQPGVLARVLGALADEKINVEEMENMIYLGAKAACARIRLDAEPSSATLQSISSRCPEVIAMDMAVIE